jgi:4-hydroxy-2-oxoheptanedioate aldolase
MGTFCSLGSVEAIELTAHAGFDFVVVDWQHGSWGRRGMAEAVRALQGADCLAVARPPVQSPFAVEWLLDMGYPVLLVPMVNSAEEARGMVEVAHYPPLGHRSQSSCRANLHFGSNYRQVFNQHFSLLVMIEHTRAVGCIEQIAAVSGVAGCFVGGTDLASSMAVDGVVDAVAMEQATERVRAAVVRAGKIAGIAVRTVEEARRRIEQGFRFIALASDRRILASALESACGSIRDLRS